ncbi:hypothetical protein ACO2Q2_06360 [Dyella sp. KRB-257]|uniref:hypothetical protein n=1 Tax=Dyella sp. KRB-257 TaxID=3400915 RepID=UPI003C095EC1
MLPAGSDGITRRRHSCRSLYWSAADEGAHSPQNTRNPHADSGCHAGLGFREVGTQTLGAGKQVSLQALEIAADTPLSRG